MRLNNYLNEQNPDDFLRSNKTKLLENMIVQLEKKCMPFIKEIRRTKKVLFSGRRHGEDFISKKVRKDREPKDTPKILHD
jgi:hypothetical protein